MIRALLIASVTAGLMAAVLYARQDPRRPTAFDRQTVLWELSLARPRSELLIHVGSIHQLEPELIAARRACSECTLLAVGRKGVRLDLGPALDKHWTEADIADVTGNWTRRFLSIGDVAGAARTFVRQYLVRLERDGLVKKSAFGVLPPLPLPDPRRTRVTPSNSWSWGALLAFAVAGVGLWFVLRARGFALAAQPHDITAREPDLEIAGPE